MNGHGLMNTSSPKLTVPQVSEHDVRLRRRGPQPVAYGSVTAPPVDSCTIRSVSSRSAGDGVARAGPGRGWARPRRRGCARGPPPRRPPRTPWPCGPARPASRAAPEPLAFSASAPVGATVISVLAMDSMISSRRPFWREDLSQSRSFFRWVPRAAECGGVRAVVQRVSQASVTVEGRVVGAIDGPGLLVLVGRDARRHPGAGDEAGAQAVGASDPGAEGPRRPAPTSARRCS